MPIASWLGYLFYLFGFSVFAQLYLKDCLSVDLWMRSESMMKTASRTSVFTVSLVQKALIRQRLFGKIVPFKSTCH